MSIIEKISQDTIAAMRLKEAGKVRLQILRLLKAAIKQKEIDERCQLDDKQVYALIAKMVKQRHDAIEHFEKGGRSDLMEKEQREIDLLQSYLPAPLTEATLDELIQEAIQMTQAASIKDMGQVMHYLKEKAQGSTDMRQVGVKVKKLLSE
jgi:uncharacterized protein YqeY